MRPLPVLAEPRPIERRVEVSLPAAVAAATGGFLVGVMTFLLVRVLRSPRRAHRSASAAVAAAARRSTWPAAARSWSTSTS